MILLLLLCSVGAQSQMLECSRYNSESDCRFFMITPIVYGIITILLSCLQMRRNCRGESIAGNISQIINLTFPFISVSFMFGWIFDTNMNDQVGAVIGVSLIDAATVSLATALSLILIEQVSTIFLVIRGTFYEHGPQLIIGLLAVTSYLWIIVINIINYKYNRLWYRAFLYFWFAFIFTSTTLLLTFGVSFLTYRESLANVPNGRRLWFVVVGVIILTGFAVPSQIQDGINVYPDKDTEFYGQWGEEMANGSKILMNVQGVGLLLGVLYAWVRLRGASVNNSNPMDHGSNLDEKLLPGSTQTLQDGDVKYGQHPESATGEEV